MDSVTAGNVADAASSVIPLGPGARGVLPPGLHVLVTAIRNHQG